MADAVGHFASEAGDLVDEGLGGVGGAAGGGRDLAEEAGIDQLLQDRLADDGCVGLGEEAVEEGGELEVGEVAGLVAFVEDSGQPCGVEADIGTGIEEHRQLGDDLFVAEEVGEKAFEVTQLGRVRDRGGASGGKGGGHRLAEGVVEGLAGLRVLETAADTEAQRGDEVASKLQGKFAGETEEEGGEGHRGRL
ncbi:MAG: hypothetical protein GY856_21650 [bacterium]|nr:hypothetical protein [bacterium]